MLEMHSHRQFKWHAPKGSAMPIVRLLQNSAFDPEAIRIITTAFESACKSLGLHDRTDPQKELLAKKIIEVAQTGERDPLRIEQGALDALGKSA
jgi:hypothetical protein